MPPLFVCQFRPSLLLPCNDYRGRMWSVAIACSGMLIEAVCLFLCFVIAVVFLHRSVPFQLWIWVPFPLILFDSLVLVFGLRRLTRSWPWLLQSERRSRQLQLLGISSRLAVCILFCLLCIGRISVVSLTVVAAFSYFLSCIMNVVINDTYIWVRLHMWDLLITALLVSFQFQGRLTCQRLWLPFYSAAISCWPLVGTGAGYAMFSLTLWCFMVRDASLRADSVSRVVVAALEIHSGCFFIATVLFSLWVGRNNELNAATNIAYEAMSKVENAASLTAKANILAPASHTAFVLWIIPAVASFVLLLLMAAVAFICFLARHTADTDDLEDGTSSIHGPYAQHFRRHQGPPLMRNMRVTLEKVGEHFYRLTYQTNKSDDSPHEGTSAAIQYGSTGGTAAYCDKVSVTIAESVLEDSGGNSISRLASAPNIRRGSSSFAVTEGQNNLPGACMDGATTCTKADTDTDRTPNHDNDSSVVAVAAKHSHCSITAVSSNRQEKSQQNLRRSVHLSPQPEVPWQERNLSTTLREEDARPAVDGIMPRNVDENTCIICFNRAATAVLLYCGHGGLCFRCAQTCFYRNGTCPTCRSAVRGLVELDETADGNNAVGATVTDVGS